MTPRSSPISARPSRSRRRPCALPCTASAPGTRSLTARALAQLSVIDGITIYGPTDAARRTSLVAFNLAGRDPVDVAHALNRAGVEARAGCHCATLAHHALGLTPPASCRLSFYLYNTPREIDHAVAAVAAIAADRRADRRVFA